MEDLAHGLKTVIEQLARICEGEVLLSPVRTPQFRVLERTQLRVLCKRHLLRCLIFLEPWLQPEEWCPDGQSWTIAALMPSWSLGIKWMDELEPCFSFLFFRSFLKGGRPRVEVGSN